MATRTVQDLTAGLIDYAGLFPPARLDMAAAAEEYQRARRSAEGWILGRFVVPAARLDELATVVADLIGEDAERPWALSVLTGEDLAAAAAHLARRREGGDGLRIEAVELKPASAGDVGRAAGLFAGIETFYELPYDVDPRPLMEVVAEHGGRAKIRSGGVTAAAFPTASEVARFLAAAAASGVAFKATAGLHHALPGPYRLTYEPDSACGAMHGFLNVFLAAAWIDGPGLDEAAVVELLGERSAAAFAFTDDEVRWRGRRLERAALAKARRRFALAYGSCSFAEPVGELRELGLL